jgi:L-rhamnose mutarotase
MLLMLATLARASADDDRQSYAVFDDRTGTLTFYCDNQKDTHSGAMDLNKDNVDPDWLQYATSITTVEFHESFSNARPTTCYYWFSRCSNLTEIKGIK